MLTTAAARMLSAEVLRLRSIMEREFAARRREALAVAQGDGDAQLAIGEDELVVGARIAHLESLLRHARVVDHDPEGPDVVRLGSRVTLVDEAGGRRDTLEMVAWTDGAAGTVSVASPVGQAILGRAAGEVASIVLPHGRERRLRIAMVEQRSVAALL